MPPDRESPATAQREQQPGRHGLMGQRISKRQQEHPQGMGEALYALVQVPAQALAFHQVAHGSQRDEGIVADQAWRSRTSAHTARAAAFSAVAPLSLPVGFSSSLSMPLPRLAEPAGVYTRPQASQRRGWAP